MKRYPIIIDTVFLGDFVFVYKPALITFLTVLLTFKGKHDGCGKKKFFLAEMKNLADTKFRQNIMNFKCR